ncbi:MAG: redoxin domain-containing protein, partial [Asgard group archaeon]|nr:redoxin domain-containing protein [Asgard group archaeon]
MEMELPPERKSKKWLKISGIVLASAIVLAAIGYGGYYFISNRNQLTPAPNFSVTTLSGENFTLSDYQGKVVVLDFMSVTCEPCKQLMPELKEISEDFNDTVVILSIDVDLSD